jgi:thioredoxin 1
MREIKNINDFQEIAQGDKPVLLDFYATWCGPCKTLLPIVEKLAKKHESDFIIAKVNVEENPELAQKFSVRSIPALFFLQGGEVKESLNGLRSEQELDLKIHQYLAVATD